MRKILNYWEKSELFYLSTINLHILCMFQLNISLNVDFMATKPQKVHKIGHISVLNFYPIVVTKKVSHPTFFNIFATLVQFSRKFRQNIAKVEIQKSKQIVNCQI